MIRPWRYRGVRRFLGPAPVAARVLTEIEAQRDLRDAQVEALRARIAQLERSASLAWTVAWYYQGTRLPARAETPTVVMRRFDHPTEVFKR